MAELSRREWSECPDAGQKPRWLEPGRRAGCPRRWQTTRKPALFCWHAARLVKPDLELPEEIDAVAMVPMPLYVMPDGSFRHSLAASRGMFRRLLRDADQAQVFGEAAAEEDFPGALPPPATQHLAHSYPSGDFRLEAGPELIHTGIVWPLAVEWGAACWLARQQPHLRREALGVIDELAGDPCAAWPDFETWVALAHASDQLALRLSDAFHADRDFGCLPIIADALEETGCTDAVILGHLRQQGGHLLGCWVLDFMRGLPE